MKLIPEEALEQHTAVLGKSGSGKTYAMKSALVEPLLQRGSRVCVIDPTSAWWGLRSHADGKRPGFQVLVLGGDHGDLPLVPGGGAAVARLLVEQGVSLVADTGLFTVGERTRWMIDFAGTVYRLNRTPLYLVLDEAHVFAPQGRVPDPEAGKMLHAVNQIASGGRSRGIRLTMITQRPQKLHKDTLTTADTLVAMRVMHPLDRGAVKDWIDGCADPALGKQVLDSLASLKRGSGWVWYPEGGYLKQVKFPPIGTFDSSATPTGNVAQAAPKSVAQLDLTEIRKAMAEAVAEAEANDPRLLRKRIAGLEQTLRTVANQKTSTIAIDATDEQIQAAEASGYVRGLDAAGKVWGAWRDDLRSQVTSFSAAASAFLAAPFPAVPMTATEALGRRAQGPTYSLEKLPEPLRTTLREGSFVTGSQPLGRAERLILTALAQYQQGRSMVQVAVLTGYAVNGGGFRNAVGALRTRALIDGRGENLTISPDGVKALGAYTRLPTGPALLQHWLGQLGKAEREVLTVLAGVYPKALKVSDVGERAGYAPDGGGFRNALGRLRTLELIAGRGELRASDNLF